MKGAESWLFREHTLSCLQEIRRHIWLILRDLRELKKMKILFLKSRWSHISKRCCCVSWCRAMMVRLVDQWTIESQEIWRVENRSHGDNDRNPVEKLIGRNRWNHPRLEALTDGCPLCQGETNHNTLLHYCWCWCWSSKSSAIINILAWSGYHLVRKSLYFSVFQSLTVSKDFTSDQPALFWWDSIMVGSVTRQACQVFTCDRYVSFKHHSRCEKMAALRFFIEPQHIKVL